MKREEDVTKQIQQLQKDKQRLDELMSLKDKDIAHHKEEISSLKSKLEGFESSNEKMRRECIRLTESKYKG